jgi:putative NADPH-quinone reductase
LFGPIEWLLHPLRVGTLNFCGFDTLEPFFGWSVAHANLEERRRLLTNWRTRLRHIETEAPQPFRYFANFPSPAMRDHQ